MILNKKMHFIGLIILLGLPACGSGRYVQRGINHYRAADYVAAMDIWSSLENDEASMNSKGLMRYLVYRGLTHYRLNQRNLAMQFLLRGNYAYQQGNPAWLDEATVAQMNKALMDLRRTPNYPTPPPPSAFQPPPSPPSTGPR